ncbi:MAG: hypothetical protein LUE17_09750 [Planctomycetaceae bacterium]|nr:hypothetical protein [Planctomycetaceae bacterium]
MADAPLSSIAVLDALREQYERVDFDPDPHDHSAVRLAALIDEPLERTLKTLVLRGDKRKYFVCVMSGTSIMDIKKVAAVAGCRQCSMVQQERMADLTGYVRGSCSPIGMREAFPTFIDTAVRHHRHVVVGSGTPGVVLRMTPETLLRASGGQFADLVPSS